MVRIDRDVMPAVAVNQQAAQTHLAHLAEGDFQRAAVGMRRCRAWRSGMAPPKRGAGESQLFELVNVLRALGFPVNGATGFLRIYDL